MISHIIVYTDSLFIGKDIQIESTHSNDQCMLLDFEMSSSIFLGSNAIKIVNKIIIVLNLLSGNYLYYSIYVPVYYNCTYVISTFHVIDLFVIHI